MSGTGSAGAVKFPDLLVGPLARTRVGTIVNSHELSEGSRIKARP
jgi:hypothetical protein